MGGSPSPNSAGESPPRLVFRTVRETFALLRLLRGTIRVMDTGRGVDLGCPMHVVMTVPVQRHQVVPRVIARILVLMMNLQQVSRSKIKSTMDAVAVLPLPQARLPGHHAGIAPKSSCPVTPFPVVGTARPLNFDGSDNSGARVGSEPGPLGRAKIPLG